MNIELASKLLNQCKEIGIKEYCLCAGARNSPLVVLLAESVGAKIYHFFEERSASFFAIGRIKNHGQPVAVITTSGTAVAELLPATVEAYYSGLPLVLITADRPRVYRNSGAPQSIEQVGIFNRYVERCVDIESLDENLDLEIWSKKYPLQVNICFDEPLLDGTIQSLDLNPEISKSFLPLMPSKKKKINKPLVIVSGLDSEESLLVLEFFSGKNIPIYAEANSNLRGKAGIQLINEKTAEFIIKNQVCQSILRIGGVPTLRLWRDLENKYSKIPVFSCSNVEFKGLSRTVYHLCGIEQLSYFEINEFDDSERSAVQQKYQDSERQLENLLFKYPESEAALIHKFSKLIVNQSIFLGNSLPIRQWDLVAHNNQTYTRIGASRGANGIDGQISTYLGWSNSEAKNWCVIGDLTTLYDLAALWIEPQLEPCFRGILIINNQGGQIFNTIFKNPLMTNSHSLDFQHWAKMWDWEYKVLTTINEQGLIYNSKRVIIELKPDAKQSDQFNQEWKHYE